MANKVQTLDGSDGSGDKNITITSISGDGGQIYNNCTFYCLCPEYQCKNAPEQEEHSLFGIISTLASLASLAQFFIKMA